MPKINTVAELSLAIQDGRNFTYRHGIVDRQIILDMEKLPLVVVPGTSPILYLSHNTFPISDEDLIGITEVKELVITN